MLKYKCLVFAITLVTELNAQSPHVTIKSKLIDLHELIGKWDVETKMTTREGGITDEKGTYTISWALDSTYFRYEAELKNTINGRLRQFESWLTYDTQLLSYRTIYLYSRTSFHVIETGKFDPLKRLLRTTSTLNLPNDITEQLRTELSMTNPNHLIYHSWSRFGNEKEFNDFTATWKRIN